MRLTALTKKGLMAATAVGLTLGLAGTALAALPAGWLSRANYPSLVNGQCTQSFADPQNNNAASLFAAYGENVVNFRRTRNITTILGVPLRILTPDIGNTGTGLLSANAFAQPTNSWAGRTTPELPRRSQNQCADFLGGRIFVIAGVDQDQAITTGANHGFDPVLRIWNRFDSLEDDLNTLFTREQRAGAAEVKDSSSKINIIGGRNEFTNDPLNNGTIAAATAPATTLIFTKAFGDDPRPGTSLLLDAGTGNEETVLVTAVAGACAPTCTLTVTATVFDHAAGTTAIDVTALATSQGTRPCSGTLTNRIVQFDPAKGAGEQLAFGATLVGNQRRSDVQGAPGSNILVFGGCRPLDKVDGTAVNTFKGGRITAGATAANATALNQLKSGTINGVTPNRSGTIDAAAIGSTTLTYFMKVDGAPVPRDSIRLDAGTPNQEDVTVDGAPVCTFATQTCTVPLLTATTKTHAAGASATLRTGATLYTLVVDGAPVAGDVVVLDPGASIQENVTVLFSLDPNTTNTCTATTAGQQCQLVVTSGAVNFPTAAALVTPKFAHNSGAVATITRTATVAKGSTFVTYISPSSAAGNFTGGVIAGTTAGDVPAPKVGDQFVIDQGCVQAAPTTTSCPNANSLNTHEETVTITLVTPIGCAQTPNLTVSPGFSCRFTLGVTGAGVGGSTAFAHAGGATMTNVKFLEDVLKVDASGVPSVLSTTMPGGPRADVAVTPGSNIQVLGGWRTGEVVTPNHIVFNQKTSKFGVAPQDLPSRCPTVGAILGFNIIRSETNTGVARNTGGNRAELGAAVAGGQLFALGGNCILARASGANNGFNQFDDPTPAAASPLTINAPVGARSRISVLAEAAGSLDMLKPIPVP